MEDLNEPAFPIQGEIAAHQFGGMSLRDYFAAKAMQSLILLPDYVDNWPSDITARDAYEYADAMLTERAKGE